MTELLHKIALLAPAPPPEGFGMSWEGMMGIAALLGVIFTLLTVVFKGGQLTNQLEASREQLSKLEDRFELNSQALTKQIEGLTRMVYELRGKLGRKGGGGDDQS